MIINKRRLFDYTLLTFFIATSGFPYLSFPNIYLFSFFIFAILFLIRKKSVDRSAILFFTSLGIITMFQTIVFNHFSLQSTIGIYLRLLSAYFIIKLLDIKFTEYYPKVIYSFALISLVLFPMSLIPDFRSLLLSLDPLFHWLRPEYNMNSILIYSFPNVHIYRNSGPFWEPGAFAGYLIIAFIFSYTANPSFKSKQNIVLLLTLLTTQSTTGFLALFVFLFFANYAHIKNIFIKIVAVALIIAAGYIAFFNLDFLGKKITEQVERAQTSSIETDQNTQRFLNILRDMKDFENHELVGRGVSPITRYSFGPLDQIRTVGLSDVLVKFGLLFFILIYYMFYKSAERFSTFHLPEKSRLYAFGIVLTISITLTSEVYFNYPFYWSLLFLMIVYKYPRRIS